VAQRSAILLREPSTLLYGRRPRSKHRVLVGRHDARTGPDGFDVTQGIQRMPASKADTTHDTDGRNEPSDRKPETVGETNDIPAGQQIITIDRRQNKPDRRSGDPGALDVGVMPNPRRKKQRRRHIDPTTCERDYSDPEIEFMRAMDDYKRKSGRMFPTCSEVLEVVRDLGYFRLTDAQVDSLGLLDEDEPETALDEGDELSEDEASEA
jgi:hypothetical protein